MEGSIRENFTLAFGIPFDSERKKMSTIRGSPPTLLVCEKGALGIILKDWIIVFVFSSLIFVVMEVIKCFKRLKEYNFQTIAVTLYVYFL